MPAKVSTLIGGLAVLATVAANNQCVLNPNPPAGATCGETGDSNNFFWSSFAPEYSTPDGCALACYQADGCASFSVSTGGFDYCALYGSSLASTDSYSADSQGSNSGYDEACFTCGPIPVSCPADDGKQYQVGRDTFDIHCYVDYYGGDLAHANTDTFAECIDDCASTDGCIDVSYNGNNCYLKNALDTLRNDTSVWTATRSNQKPFLTCPGANNTEYTTSTGETFKIQCGVDYYGNDINQPYADNFNDCLEDCGNTTTCVGVALHGNYCYLKNALSNPQQDSAVWGAVLVAQEGFEVSFDFKRSTRRRRGSN